MEDDLKSLCSIVFWVKLLFPAVIVFGAMYWAQHIFNGNARNRENRERRLRHAEVMMNDTSKIFIIFKTYRNNSSMDTANKCVSDIFELISLLNSNSAIYKFNLGDSINLFNSEFTNANHHYFDHMSNDWASDSSETPLSYLGSPTIDGVMNALRVLKDDIIKLHNKIESDK